MEKVYIIDQHRLDAAKTELPIFIDAEHLGSTCTMVYRKYVMELIMKHMRKHLAIVLSIIMTLVAVVSLNGCGTSVSTKEVAEYLADATPESSALAFYIYDGSTTTVRYLFDKKAIREILDDLSKVKALPVVDYGISKTEVPFYGISIGSSSTDGIRILFAGGFAILADGRGYKFDYDFGKYLNKYAWQETMYIGGLSMPCEYWIASGQLGWNKDFLNMRDNEINDGLKVEMLNEGESQIELEITNNMGMNWRYGEYRWLEVQLDDEWYVVPTREPLYVNDIAYEMFMGDSRKHTYYMSYYGELPQGTYRIVIDGTDADAAYEFTR